MIGLEETSRIRQAKLRYISTSERMTRKMKAVVLIGVMDTRGTGYALLRSSRRTGLKALIVDFGV
jgi:hypothetical protein